jgi:hypothetical protein
MVHGESPAPCPQIERLPLLLERLDCGSAYHDDASEFVGSFPIHDDGFGYLPPVGKHLARFYGSFVPLLGVLWDTGDR